VLTRLPFYDKFLPEMNVVKGLMYALSECLSVPHLSSEMMAEAALYMFAPG
jgi:hypothetical protein